MLADQGKYSENINRQHYEELQIDYSVEFIVIKADFLLGVQELSPVKFTMLVSLSPLINYVYFSSWIGLDNTQPYLH